MTHSPPQERPDSPINAGGQLMSERFECLIYDADLPSMTARFRMPEGFPLAGGIFEIRRVRTATKEDRARWDGFAKPPEYADEEDSSL